MASQLKVSSPMPYHRLIADLSEVDADDAWGDVFDSPTPTTSAKKSLLSVRPVQLHSSMVHSSWASSSRPTSVISQPPSEEGWETPDTTRSQSPKAPVTPSMTGMSKEEKAAEIARRRAERKQARPSSDFPLVLICMYAIIQRIAQLKEQKEQKYNKASGANA